MSRPLFLQEGNRLTGGKQDRTILTSVVIPPHSRARTVRALCIEPGRWREGSHGLNFAATPNAALASKSVRLAAKVARDQERMWASVDTDEPALAPTVAMAGYNIRAQRPAAADSTGYAAQLGGAGPATGGRLDPAGGSGPARAALHFALSHRHLDRPCVSPPRVTSP